MRSKIIDIPIFNIKFRVYIGNIKKAGAKYGRVIENDTMACMLQNPQSEKPYKRVLLFRKSVSMNTLTHECTHLVNSVCSYIGYNLDHDNDEMYCYLVGYVNQMVYDFYVQNKK